MVRKSHIFDRARMCRFDVISSPHYPMKIVKAWLFILFSLFVTARAAENISPRWPVERANAWYSAQPWLVGSNYIPAYAGNQLEMWQADTFDLKAIEREMGWAQSLGFNTLRVFLHDLAWKQDPQGFLERMDQFLGAADRHGLRPIVVIFDGVWHPNPKPGRQPAPAPHVHNSVWLQSPGREILESESAQEGLEPYVKAVIGRFSADRRVLAWDLFNEPDNPNVNAYGKLESSRKAEVALNLLRRVFRWARDVNPSQPLTAGVWHGNWDPATAPLAPMTAFMLEQSDVISFHDYNPIDTLRMQLRLLQRYGRPILCTEYMARPRDSRFETILPYLRDEHVAAINWGFVAGRSQTIYPWDSWLEKYTAEPKIWFHDIFRSDGTPYDPAEVRFIRKILGP
jgi:hypothetical protein